MRPASIKKVSKEDVDKVCRFTRQRDKKFIASIVACVYKRAQINQRSRSTVTKQPALLLPPSDITITAHREPLSVLGANREATPYLYLLRDRELGALKHLFQTVAKGRA